jgi:beta-glucosidase
VEASSTELVVSASLKVTNTGDREGTEVVQLYVSDLVASVARPERALVGFARVRLRPAEAATVTFTVHPSRLAFYDDKMRFVVEPGEFCFAVGSSARDVRCEQVVELSGDLVECSQRSIVPTRSSVVLVG